MRFKGDEGRRTVARVLYILSGISLVSSVGLAIYLFYFNVETEAPGSVASTRWRIVQLVGLVVGGVAGLLQAWQMTKGSDKGSDDK